MSDNVWVNADKTAVVDQFAPGKKWQMRREEAVKRGLLDDENAPQQKRRAPAFDATKATAPVEPKKRTTRRKRK